MNGAEYDNSASFSGAAYVFVRDGTTWTQQAYLKASNNEGVDFFGQSVALSGDTVVVGSSNEDSGATRVNGVQSDNSASDSGAAYVFVRDGTTWTQQAYLKASNAGNGDQFGSSVSVSGNMVVVGASGEDSGATGVNGNQADNGTSSSGAAYAFVRSGTLWTQQAYLKASNTEGADFFGQPVAVSGDTVVVGASSEDSGATGVNTNQADNGTSNSGAAYVFSLKPTLTTVADHGTVTGGGEYDLGNTATLTAMPAPGYLFNGWSGDADSTENPLTVVMNANKTITASFAPDAADDDGDGLTNFQEIVELGTDPTKPDTDIDGVNDKNDAFPLNPAETLDTDQDGTGDNADTDDDGDGYSDTDELNLHHTNPKRTDSDGDGLSDPAEIETHHTNANIADTDNDGLLDGEEITTYLSNPLVGDTDGDGFLDGYEILTGKLPLDPLSKPALVAEARTAIELTFPAAVGKTYRIEDSPDLENWRTVESGISGTGGQVQRFYSTRNLAKRYFRVEEEAP